jgi:hypothetical protein
MPLLSSTTLRDHLIHQLGGKHLRHHPDRHHIRQPPRRLRLHPTSTRHTPKLHTCSSNWTVLRLCITSFVAYLLLIGDSWTTRDTVLAVIGNAAMIGAVGFLTAGLLTPKTHEPHHYNQAT